jgi:hypothetical protein
MYNCQLHFRYHNNIKFMLCITIISKLDLFDVFFLTQIITQITVAMVTDRQMTIICFIVYVINNLR